MNAGTGRWRRLLKLAVILASLGGLAWLLAAQHDQLGEAITGIGQAKVKLIVAAAVCERVSVFAVARMQTRLLRAGGHHLGLRSAAAIFFAGNALSASVPIAGAGLSVAYSYREFERRKISRPAAAYALLVSGVLSTLSLMVIVALGALVSGNTVAVALGLLGVAAAAAGIVGTVLALRVPACRRLAERLAIGGVRVTQRLSRKPGEPPEAAVTRTLRQLADLHLRRSDWAVTSCLAFLNWLGDAACLALSIKAAGLPIPFRDLLLVWSAGSAAASISFTPGGIGIVEPALVAAMASIGMPTARATIAVLIYRLISLWLIVLVGWILFLLIRFRRPRRAEI